MKQEKENMFRALDAMTDRSWSPLNLFRLTGTVHPIGLTPREVVLCKGLCLVFSANNLPGVIQILYGPEAREMFEEQYVKLKYE